MNKYKSANLITLRGRYELAKDILEAALHQGVNDEIRKEEFEKIFGVLRNVEYSFSKRQSLSSTELRQALTDLQININSLERTLQSHCKLIEDIDLAEFNRIEDIKSEVIRAIESFAGRNPKREDVDKILSEIQSLKVSKKRDPLGFMGDISSIIGLGLTIISLLASRR
jgi:predicted RNA-binding protein with EMAP domain